MRRETQLRPFRVYAQQIETIRRPLQAGFLNISQSTQSVHLLKMPINFHSYSFYVSHFVSVFVWFMTTVSFFRVFSFIFTGNINNCASNSMTELIMYAHKNEHFEIGKTASKDVLPCYELERTICDHFKNHTQIHRRRLRELSKKSRNRDVSKIELLKFYAEQLKVSVAAMLKPTKK